MQRKKTFKMMAAAAAVIALLCGMIPMIGIVPMAAEETEPARFTADFSEVKAILDAGNATYSDNRYMDAAYTPIGDTTTLNGQLNTWMREHFSFKTNKMYSSTRSWFGQKTDEVSDKEANGWGNNGTDTTFFLNTNGNLQLKVTNVSNAQMLQRVETIIPQFSSTNVKLKNFKATVKYVTKLPNYRGAILFSFDETAAGETYFKSTSEYPYKRTITGSTLVLGNGTGNDTAVGKDGWVFYDKTKTQIISGTTVDEKVNSSVSWQEVAITDGVRFSAENSKQQMTLTVEVKNGKAAFTLEREDGTKETMEKAYVPQGGFVSIGLSNRDYVVSYVDITEYDEAGNAVDFGTYHNSLYGISAAVETFEADFTDLPDAHYVSGKYLYNKNHDVATGYGVGLTERLSASTVTAAGAFTTGKAYTVHVKDTALVDYLENKFNFYVYANGGGGVFERWNAAGYIVDSDGNNLSSGFKSSGKAPATGDGASYAPGSGQGGYSSLYPTMTVDSNRFLHLMPDVSGWAATPFNVTSYFTVQNKDGGDAVLKNFRLDLDFKLTTASATSFPKNQSPVFVKFGGYEAPTFGCTDGSMFAVSYNGGYYLDNLSRSYNTGYGWDGSQYAENVSFTANTFTKNATSNALNYPSYAGSAIGSGVMHLTLTVKNKTVQATVTDEAGNVVLRETKTDMVITSGLISIGTTYAGIYHGMPYFGAVKVTRLGEDGEPVDFTVGDEDVFTASFAGLTDYNSGNYYRNNGAKADALTAGAVKKNWLTDKTAGQFAFGAQDERIVAYLSERFDFYHATPDGKLLKMASPYQDTYTLYEDNVAGVENHGQWKLDGGRMLRATFTRGAFWGDLYRNQLTLVPKIQGKATSMYDFKTEFDYAHLVDTYGAAYGTLLFTFRSSKVAQTADAGNSTFKDAVTVAFTHFGVSVYDGTVPDRSNNGHAGTDQYLFGGNINAAHVSIEVSGSKMSIKVTSPDGATVYCDQSEIELTTGNAGYAYFSVLNSDIALGDIVLIPDKSSNIVFAEAGEAVVKASEGFELKAGSLIAKTEDGSVYVPQRVGFRQGGSGMRYTLIGNSTVSAYEFVRPTLDAPNIGKVGISFNRELHGLRFVTRFTRRVIEGTEYVVTGDGSKYAISDYGMLVAAESGLATTAATDAEDMVLNSENTYVKCFSAKTLNKYYDVCDDYIDLSASIINMDKASNFDAIKEMDMYVRTYVTVEVDGQPRTLYSDVFSACYYDGLSGATVTATMTELRDDKTLLIDGRHLIADETATKGFVEAGDVVVDFGNAGITVAGDLAGDIYADVAYNMYTQGECRINVMVDGAYVDDVIIKYGESRVRVVKGLKGGYHTVKLSKGVGTPSFGDLIFKKLTYNGYLSTPIVNDFQIEFLGDSITDTVGIMGAYHNAADIAGQTNPTENVRLGYAALTSQALGADFTLVSMSGNTISMTSDLFKETTWKYQGQDMPYTFGSGDTTEKDVVVINLGTNGLWGATEDNIATRRPEIQSAAKECLTAVRSKYPNAYIVWVYGMLCTQYEEVLAEAVADWASENNDSKTSYCSLAAAANTQGAGMHPAAVGHEAAAKILTQYLADLLDISIKQEVVPATVTLAQLTHNNTVQVNGRHTVTDEGNIKVSFGNAGITIAGYLVGDVYADVAYTKYAYGRCRINVMVDGEYVEDVIATYGDNTLKVVTGLKDGYHTVKISKGAGTPSLGDLVFKSITYSGSLETPAVNERQFLFLGDSITDTAGILGAYSDAPDAAGVQLPSQNIRLGYAALTSKAFGADFTQVSFAGLPIPSVTSLFLEEKQFPNNGSYTPYEYGSGDTTDKEVVVINLGTNISAGDMAQDVKDCLTAVRNRYPNAYIVWTYGLMFTTQDEFLRESVETWAAETGDTKTSYCSLVQAANTDGGAQHPLAPYHAQAAEILTQHIATLLHANA